jgi:molecular chaperone GrpE
LKKCETERQEYLVGWQRAKADFVNARKREEEDRKVFVKRAEEDLVTELIPVLESFDAAMNTPAWQSVDDNWRKGVEYIAVQLRGVLTARGVSELNPINEPFDPERDEAVERVTVTDASRHDKVIEVAAKGYALHGHILRAPRVRVGDYNGTETNPKKSS